jgi:hypothetical protein
VEVPVREEANCGCEAPAAYVPPPVEENCNCEAPAPTTYTPPARTAGGNQMPPRREYFRDSAQTELQRD